MKAYLGYFNDFFTNNKDKYNFFFVYINEAHAKDVWPIGALDAPLSHKKIEDRTKCASELKEEYKLTVPVYCDNMENDFEDKLAGWPIRCYVIDSEKKFAYINTPTNAEFDIEDFLNFLNNYTTKS